MPTHFVGREELVAEVARRLIAGTTLALSADGLPGVGKTTLAVALAYRREILDHFTDGVLWGALGLQPNVMEVLATWAAALGIDVSQATDPSKRAAFVHNAIGQRRFLLVIDDAWEPAENALLLRCGGPNCVHFLTTRNETIARAFAGTAGKVEIKVLDPDDALELLKKLAPEACEADPDAARELVLAVGYLPLAIELMGAYLSAAENRYFRELQTAALRSMADPAERLRQASKRLGDAQGAQVTLKDTIRLSLEGLAQEAVDAFHALGAFAPKPETFDSEAAVAVTGASLDSLSRLIDRHLLEKEGESLALHQTVADVARENTHPDAMDRHALHFLKRMREAGEDWRVIEADYAQAKWSFEHLTAPEAVLAFTSALKRYQSLRGLREDALHWNGLEIEATEKLGYVKEQAEALVHRGWLHNQLGDRERALDYYNQGLLLMRRVGETHGEASTLNNIGTVYFNLGERDHALEYYEQALALLRAINAKQDEAITLNNIGNLYDSLGKRDLALNHFNEALQLFRDLGNRQREGITLNNIGAVLQRLGERERALEHFEDTLLLMRAVGDINGEATTLNNIGSTYDDVEEHERAMEFYERALPLLRAVGNKNGEAITLHNIGAIHNGLGQRDTALQYFQQSLALLRAVGDRSNEILTRFRIAMIYLDSGERTTAVEELRQVIELEAALKDKRLAGHRRFLAQLEADLRQTESG